MKNMARSNKSMSITKVDAQMAARKRFKITFGKALQNVPGRPSTSATPKPRVAVHSRALTAPPVVPRTEAAQEDYLAKAVATLTVIKSQSGLDLTEKLKELVHLAREQGYLANED